MIQIARKPMLMSNYTRFVLCVFSLAMQPFCLWSQEQNTYDSRDAFYDSLESRARALSQRLAEISGTEPIPFERTAPTILSTVNPPPPTKAQNAFDSLPEPKGGSSNAVPVSSDDKTLYRADGTPVTLEPEPSVSSSDSPPAKLLEAERGRYFIQPFIGLGFLASDATHSKTLVDNWGNDYTTTMDIDPKVGHAVGMGVGRRWDNFDGELHFSYATLDYDSVTLLGSTNYAASGDMDVFQLGARVGYGIPMGDSGWVRVAGGFGLGKRQDFIRIDQISQAYSSNETSFTYDLLFSLGYETQMGLDAFLAYRLLGISSNGEFGKMAMHLFELGLGSNF